MHDDIAKARQRNPAHLPLGGLDCIRQTLAGLGERLQIPQRPQGRAAPSPPPRGGSSKVAEPHLLESTAS